MADDLDPIRGEHLLRFDCFGAGATVVATPSTGTWERMLRAREFLLEVHRTLTLFDASSELSRLNRDPRPEVGVSPLLAEFAAAAVAAAELSGGLVDATADGARHDRRRSPGGPTRHQAEPSPGSAWQRIEVDLANGVVRRPPGVRLDSGGIAKGWAADLASGHLDGLASYGVECSGDLRVGGSARTTRMIDVAHPLSGEVLGRLGLRAGGVATSGITRRAWLDRGGSVTHHLIDPASGAPCFSGVLQATALAPSGFLAEVRAKSAVLGGPDRARDHLPDGGVLVLDDGSVVEVPRSARERAAT